MSIAGQTRRSASLRSSTNSMFPVPLNSWKINSSIRDPVSTRAVPTMVSEPPSANARAVAKSFFGISIALMFTPPVMVGPELPTHLLKARAKRVIESISKKTSFPISARRRQRSITNWLSRTCESTSSSRLLAMTSPRVTLRRISVTSSGRSSINRTINSTSG